MQFKNPQFVERFAERYMIAAGSATGSFGTMSDFSTLAIQAHGLIA